MLGSARSPGFVRSRWLERGGVVLILLAALFVRARRLADPFGSDFGGHQGAFFAIAAVDYERFGVGRFGGYPILALDGPSLGGKDDLALPRDGTGNEVVYVNHPPTTALLAWASLKIFGPDGWSEAWREHRAPVGVEAAERTPFLLLHLLGLGALWWAMRQGFGSQPAMLALALYAALPVSIVYGPLANLENPAIPFALLALGFHARFVREGRRADLAAQATCLAIACSVTYAPLFLVPALGLHLALRGDRRRAVQATLVCGAAALLPLLVNAFWAGHIASDRAGLLDRARYLIGPLLDGSTSPWEWIWTQLVHLRAAMTLPALFAAAIGLGVLALRREKSRVDVVTPLLLAATLYLVAFYRHTLEDQRMFLLWLAPAVAALGAIALDAAAPALLRLRGGVAPLVVATSLIVMPCLAREAEIRAELAVPSPVDAGREIARLVPPDAVVLCPESAGYNLAWAFYAWRNVAPGRSREDLDRLLERWPRLRGKPAFLVAPSVDARWSVRPFE